MLGFFKKKTLDSHLGETRKIKVSGVPFVIKKINVLDHLHGSQVMTEQFHVWRKSKLEGNKINEERAFDKIKKHYTDVFVSSVIDPVIKRKEEDCAIGEIWSERLFVDFGLAQDLYTEIMLFTHGKKKMRGRLLKSL